MKIAAGEFKAKCLKLMEKVQKFHQEIIVTKFGKPVAKLVPIEKEPERTLFGFLKGSVIVQGDIITPIGEKWDAEK